MKNFFLIFFLFTMSLFSFEIEKVNEFEIQPFDNCDLANIKIYDDYIFATQYSKSENSAGQGIVVMQTADGKVVEPKKETLSIYNIKGEFLYTIGKTNSYEMGGTISPSIVGFKDGILEVSDNQLSRYYFFKIYNDHAELIKTVVQDKRRHFFTIKKVCNDKFYSLNHRTLLREHENFGFRGDIISNSRQEGYYELGDKREFFYPITKHRKLVNHEGCSDELKEKLKDFDPVAKETLLTGGVYIIGNYHFNTDNSYYVYNYLGIDICKYDSDDNLVVRKEIPSVYKIQKDFFDNYKWEKKITFYDTWSATGLIYDEKNDTILLTIQSPFKDGKTDLKYLLLDGTTLEEKSEMFELDFVPNSFDKNGTLWGTNYIDGKNYIVSYKVRY